MAVTYVDYSGGYATDMPNDLMPDNMLLTSENWYWDSQFTKRQGKSTYVTFTGYSAVLGFHRVYINNEWTTIFALDDVDTAVATFWRMAGTTKTQIGSKTWTAGQPVRFASLNQEVVAVNGTDEPVIIYYDSGYQIADLEQYDARVRELADWGAGQYDTSAGTYTDDTDDAQDSTADDFLLASTSAGDGFYIASTLIFNKVVMTKGQQFDSGTAAYEYYKGSGSWGNVTLTTTPSWTGAEGTKTIEFDVPDDWVVYDVSTTGLADRYVFRVRFTSAPGSAKYCDTIAVSYTRIITNLKNILGGSQFHLVHEHGSRIWLGNTEGVAYSPHNTLTGWYDYYVEYFAGGGHSLMAMRSYSNELLVFKSNSMWRYAGNTFEDFYKQKVLDVGTISENGPAVINKTICFPAEDGIYTFGTNGLMKVSKHIATNYNSYTKTNSYGVNYKGYYWLSFPTNSVVLIFDPDTQKTDQMGDGVVSFYKFPSYHIERMMLQNGDGDNGYFIGAEDAGTYATFRRLQDGTYADSGISGVAIPLMFQTKYMSLGKPLYQKVYKRILFDVAIAGNYSCTLYRDDGTSAGTFTLASATGTGHYVEDVSMPYELDGRNFSIKIANSTALNAKVYAMTADVSVRRL